MLSQENKRAYKWKKFTSGLTFDYPENMHISIVTVIEHMRFMVNLLDIKCE